MTEAVCRRCGSDLDVISVCKFCNQPLKFGCQSCGNIADEKVHVDCRNAELPYQYTTKSGEPILIVIISDIIMIRDSLLRGRGGSNDS